MEGGVAAIALEGGIIGVGRGHDRRALSDLEQASCGSSSCSSRRLLFAPSWRRRRSYGHQLATLCRQFVEHASSEASVPCCGRAQTRSRHTPEAP